MISEDSSSAPPNDPSFSEQDGAQLWYQVLSSLKEHRSEYVLSWVSKMRCAGASSDRALLLVPDKFFRDFVDDHFRRDLERELAAAAGRPLQINYQVDAKLKSCQPLDPAKAPPGPARQLPLQRHPRGQLDERFIFDQFVVAASNQLAWAGAKALADKPSSSYSPLFIYGGTGLGKTHLLHAIGNTMLTRDPSCRVLYASSEGFTNEFIASVRDHKMPEFRRKYREECDLLLMDDVQFLGTKEMTQEEFFHTFNALSAARKPLAITCDTVPAEIPGLEERLKSRLQSGLTADIQEPEYETRVAILKKKAEAEGVVISDEVCQFLARSIQKNVRELEGALIKIAAIHSLTGQPITDALATQVLRDIIPAPRPIDAEQVQREVAKYYKIAVDDLRSARRHKQLAHARQVAMFLTKKLTGSSYPEVGRNFDRDHSTVISACQKIESSLRSGESAIRKELEDISSRLTR